jgi:predicted ATPase
VLEGDTFLRSVSLVSDRIENPGEYPFSIPAIEHLGTLELDPGVTFLVGENGSGKSTLVEAIAAALGLNPEGGSKNFGFSSRATHSTLHDAVRLTRGTRTPKTSYFLRAESFYNLATEVEALDDEGRLLKSYGGQSLHAQSHGESFLALVLNRFGPEGLYLLDEPEAALSVPGCLAMLARMRELTDAGSQFVVATHSPVLSGYPGALIYEMTDAGPERVAWEDTDTYRLTKSFLDAPERFLRELLPE